MIRRLFLAFAVMLWGVCASAQAFDHVEIFGGYSYAPRDFSGATINRTGFSNDALNRGWTTSVNLKFNRHVGFVTDVAGYHKHVITANDSLANCTAVSCSSSAYTLMFGPQVSFPLPKITPFVQALLGIAHATPNAASVTVQDNTSIAAAWGGGLDYHLSHHIALRVQADYLLTNFTYTDNQIDFKNDNARLSGGLVLRF